VLYRCLLCLKVWGDGEDEEYYSHGYCVECLRKLLTEHYRNKQRMSGHFDCFGKAYDGNCDQKNCEYREVCLGKTRNIRIIKRENENVCMVEKD
jgi:hypothetical protein